MQVLLEVTIPVFLVIAAGYLAVRVRFLEDAHIRGLMKFAQGVAIPCLLFRAISDIDFAARFNPAFMLSFYSGSVVAFLLGFLGARHLFGRELEDSIAIGFTALFGNTVLVGLAIVGRAYGGDVLDNTYLLVAFHAPFCYLIGITSMEVARSSGQDFAGLARAVLAAMFSNAIMVGIAAGLVVNFLAIPVPVLIGDALDMVKATALPAALFGLGGILVRYRPEGDVKIIAWICLLSLVVHPAIAWIIVGPVFGLDQSMVRSSVITAAMAPGINTYIFASMYGRAMRVAASSVLIGTILSVATASAWIMIAG